MKGLRHRRSVLEKRPNGLLSALSALCCGAILYVLLLFTCRLCYWERQTGSWPQNRANSRGFAGVNWGLIWFVLLALQEALPSPLKQLPCDYSLMASVSYTCFKPPATATYQMIRLMLQRHKVNDHFSNLSLKTFLRLFCSWWKPEGWRWHANISICCKSLSGCL